MLPRLRVPDFEALPSADLGLVPTLTVNKETSAEVSTDVDGLCSWEDLFPQMVASASRLLLGGGELCHDSLATCVLGQRAPREVSEISIAMALG